jgi:NADH-quinone oxidoreductase subunit I
MRRHWLPDIVVSLWSIAKGLAVTLRNTARPRVTLDYPAKPVPIFPRYRGRLKHLKDESGRLKCTACLACQKACPSNALPTIEGDDGKGREKRAKTYLWDSGRCLFCGYCVEACPFDAIRLTTDFSVVTERREDLQIGLEQLLQTKGGEQ